MVKPVELTTPGRTPELLHFRAFEAILRLGSLTAAAQALGLTQPALSKSLALLRRYYGDELFVRSKQGMRPTAMARGLASGVQQLLGLVDRDLRAATSFDPLTSTRVFRISCTEVGAIHFMPRLMDEVRVAAPGVRWDIRPQAGDAAESQLASGEVDLVLAAYASLGPSVESEPLYRVGHVCLVRQGHPRVGGQLSLAQFCAEKHVVASINDQQHAYSRVELAIIRAAGADAIGLRVHSLLTAPYIVAHSDHVFTATAQVAQQLAALPGLRIVNCPLQIEDIEVHQYWHSRYAHDPAVMWLRELVSRKFRSSANPEA